MTVSNAPTTATALPSILSLEHHNQLRLLDATHTVQDAQRTCLDAQLHIQHPDLPGVVLKSPASTMPTRAPPQGDARASSANLYSDADAKQPDQIQP